MNDLQSVPASSDTEAIGLGIDAGGTSTRWALADGAGRVLAQGSVAGLTALMMGSDPGREQMAATLRQLAHDVGDVDFAAGPPQGKMRPLGGQRSTRSDERGGHTPQRVLAGFTAYSDDPPLRASLEALIAGAFALPDGRVRVLGDIALAYLDCFAPGAGYLVSAGTGSIAATIDAAGQMHRVGGRGSLLDDGGSGHWIVREAMRHIWREEDAQPGSWRGSRLAQCVFARIGGSEWARSRDFIYQGTRGQVGELALAVAAAAHDQDVVALRILRQAGVELARLVLALEGRFGARPVALAGRVAQLHPVIEHSMHDALGSTAELRVVTLHAHETAARLAARDDPMLHRLTDAEPCPQPQPPMPEPAGP